MAAEVKLGGENIKNRQVPFKRKWAVTFVFILQQKKEAQQNVRN